MRNDTASLEMDVDKSALSLEVTPSHHVIGIDSPETKTQVCATVTACDLPDDDSKRAAVDIVVALDVSGSMAGDKLALCKKTLELLIRQLSSQDRFGLVSFADDAQIETTPVKMTTQAKASTLEKIKALQTRGCTNISAAIGLAAQEIQSIPTPNEVQSIFLLTDGLANSGITDHGGLCELTNKCLSGSGKSDTPISMHCFGYGSGHSDSLLRELSSVSQGGVYYFVEDDSAVVSAFGDALGGILSVVAQNAVLSIKIPESQRLNGVKIIDVYDDRKIKVDDGFFKVTIGDFYAEESRDVLFSISLASKEVNVPHVEVSVSYTDALLKSPAVTPLRGCSIVRPDGKELSVPVESVRVQWLRVKTLKEIETANSLAREGRLDEAKKQISMTRGNLKSEADLQSNDLVMQLQSDLEGLHDGLESSQTFRSVGAQTFSKTAQTYARQRCAVSEAETSHKYRSKKRYAMSLKLSKLSK